MQLDTRRILKRLAKENLKQLGRMVAKLAHANPMIVLRTIVQQVCKWMISWWALESHRRHLIHGIQSSSYACAIITRIINIPTYKRRSLKYDSFLKSDKMAVVYRLRHTKI